MGSKHEKHTYSLKNAHVVASTVLGVLKCRSKSSFAHAEAACGKGPLVEGNEIQMLLLRPLVEMAKKMANHHQEQRLYGMLAK